jgi:hypothetical protein
MELISYLKAWRVVSYNSFIHEYIIKLYDMHWKIIRNRLLFKLGNGEGIEKRKIAFSISKSLCLKIVNVEMC